MYMEKDLDYIIWWYSIPFSLFLKIVTIYVNLAKGDKFNIFPAAITRDGRSYNEQVYSSAYIFSLYFVR